jgi:hypothetical protein
MLRLSFLFSASLLVVGSAAARAQEPVLDDEPAPETEVPEADFFELERRVLTPQGIELEPKDEPLVIVEQSSVAAPEIVEEQLPRQPGTHGVLELNAGATLGSELGEAGGALVGFGGKPVGFPWRFYFIGEVGQAHVRDAGFVAGGEYATDRRYWNVAAGLRIYIPVWGPVRIFGDATLGGAYVASSLARPDVSPRAAGDWYILGAVAAGVQIRVLHQLAFGLRAKLLLTDDGLSELRETLGIASAVPAMVTLGLTWHI